LPIEFPRAKHTEKTLKKEIEMTADNDVLSPYEVQKL
jgi:hypothetical protein